MTETKVITIHVDAESAHFFETASAEKRRKMEILLSLKLNELTRQIRPLEEIMSEISRNAQARGLTPEILENILNDES
jgi:hypothetical protein